MRKWLTEIGKTMKNVLEAQNKGRSGWYKHYRVRTAQLEREL